MSTEHIAVCCKLPHGLIINDPLDRENKVQLNGPNKSAIIGATYGITMVKADFWESWIAFNRDFPAVKSGAIFIAKNTNEADAMAKDFQTRKTGFEGMPQKTKDIKPANEKED